MKPRSPKRNGAAAAVAAASLLVIAACSGGSPNGASFSPPEPAAQRAGSSSGSVSNAYEFLRLMMDKYAKGSTTRLVQSFDGGPLRRFKDAVTYDDALFIDALLAQGSSEDIARSEVLGNAFLYLQTIR